MNAINQRREGEMIIRAKDRHFKGTPREAFDFVRVLRRAYRGMDMPKNLHDLVFAVEVALQNGGYLDEDLNRTRKRLA